MEYLNLNLDKNLTLNSNTTISSQKALKSYIDAKRINLDFLQASAPSEFSIGDKWLNTTDKKVYTATSSSTWDSGVALTDGQIYSFENLLYHYDGTNILIYSTETITEQNNRNEIKSWFGTQNEYDALSEIDDNTTYYIVDNASVVSTLLATQQEFNNSVQNKAATPYQVNQKLGNYLPLAGGNLDANAVLRLTNSNNGTVTLAYNTNNYLTVSSNLSVNGTTSTNSLIATSGNIYNGSISGDTVVWSNTLNNYLPLSGGTMTGPILWNGASSKVFGLQLTSNNTNIDGGWTWSNGDGAGFALRSNAFSNVAERGAFVFFARNGTNTANTKQLKGYTNGTLTWDEKNVITSGSLATSSTAGIVKPDGTTTSVDANGVISVIGGGSGGGSVILLQFLQSTTPTTYSTDDKWLNTSDYKLYTATSSSAWDSGTTITEDQIFGFNNLLYHYNGTSLEIYSTESIKEQNAGNETKLWVGTQDEYDSISTYDVNTIYNIVDSETSLANQYHPPLLSFMWSDHLLNDVRWLRADTFSWQSGDVYTAAYQHLFNDVFTNVGTLYCWRSSSGDIYTIKEIPDVGDAVYVVNNGIAELSDTVAQVQINLNRIYPYNSGAHLRTSEGDVNNVNVPITPQTETIGSYTITYYKADDGHKITADETAVANIYNESGVAWYYVIDTTNQRFKLPRTQWGFTGLRNSAGNYVQESLPNITGQFGGGDLVRQDNGVFANGAFSLFETGVNKRPTGENGADYGVQMDASNSSSIYQDNAPVQQRATQMYLYFYVGNYTEQAIEQTAGLNTELLNDKADTDLSNVLANIDYVIESKLPTAQDLTWYRVWKSGWVEQGGRYTLTNQGSGQGETIALPKEMADTNYIVLCGPVSNTDNWPLAWCPLQHRTTTTINLDGTGNYTGAYRTITIEWEVKGQGA